MTMNRKLYEAAESGDITFLQQDPILDLDQVTPQKNTILHIALNFKKLEFSKQVLGLCSSLLLKANSKGESPLHVAAKIQCFEIAELLVNSAKTLHKDVESGVVDTQKELLRMVNQEKDTVLHIAVRKGDRALVKLLIKVDPGLLDLVNNVDASPLYLAVERGFYKIITHILENYPTCHFGGSKGLTALHSAVIRARIDIVEVLLEKRRDMIKEVDILDRTPLHYAAFRGDIDITQLLLKCDSSTAYLLDKDRKSALHLAAFEGHIQIVEELIQCCPDIAELVDKKCRTALHVAIINGQKEMVRYILKMPKLASIINEQDNEGNTALHLAVIHERIHIMKYLALEGKIEMATMNKKFSTAYDIFHSQRKMPSYSVAKTHYFLRGTLGLPYIQQRYKEMEMMGEVDREQGKSVLGDAKENSDETTKSMIDIHLLVATLIATVTFTAAFSMPGGYKECPHDKGIPTFIGKAIFKAFVIFNTTAFCFSIATVFIHVGTSQVNYRARSRYTILGLQFIFIALYGMILAFASGVYLVVAKSTGLALALPIMAFSWLLVYIVLWFFDPMVRIPGLSNARHYLRNILFYYGII